MDDPQDDAPIVAGLVVLTELSPNSILSEPAKQIANEVARENDLRDAECGVA